MDEDSIKATQGKPTIWWLNTNILDGHYTREGLLGFYDDEQGREDMEASTGCSTLEELLDTEECKVSMKTRSRAAYNASHSCATIGYSFYGRPQAHAEFMEYAEKLASGEGLSIASVSETGTLLRGALNKVRVLVEDVKRGDIVWMRDKTCGIYYIGQVSKDSSWRNVRDRETICFDCTNQLSNIHWTAVGAEDAVPGVISTQNRGTAIQRISKKGAIEFSTLLINDLAGKGAPYEPYDIELVFEGSGLADDAATFFRMLDADSAEDLFCAWLFAEHGYIPIPSTNKRKTAAYEFTMVEPNTGKKCFPQVKNDKLDEKDKLDAQGYEALVEKGDVWLLVTREPEESIENFDKPREGVHVMSSADVEDLHRFAKENRKWMSDEIAKWVEWLEANGTAR